ncbi:MAG: amidohydrolase family protein [Bacteroidia bacterium]|nr:amidohydrolase family protein [Bacteroidia bacterium]
MSRTLTADWLFTGASLRKGWALELGDAGQVLACRPLQPGEQSEALDGLLCPGFVNAHTHLELSHLAGRIPGAGGMAAFIGAVVQLRGQDNEEKIRTAAESALHSLRACGTALAGDICNSPLTVSLKRAPDAVHTVSFIELLGLDAGRAPDILARGQELLDAFAGLEACLTLHAPYSVSPALLAGFAALPLRRLSIHLLESAEEEILFSDGSGPLADWFTQLRLPWQPFPVRDPAAYLSGALPPEVPVLWVHNTRMTPARLAALLARSPQSWFCLCPRSNLYLHGQLPDPVLWQSLPGRICLGTDSLASAPSLDVWEEARLLMQADPGLLLEEVLRWLTANGAAALGQSDNFGSFAPGTRPGVNLITDLAGDPPVLTGSSRVIPIE